MEERIASVLNKAKEVAGEKIIGAATSAGAAGRATKSGISSVAKGAKEAFSSGASARSAGEAIKDKAKDVASKSTMDSLRDTIINNQQDPIAEKAKNIFREGSKGAFDSVKESPMNSVIDAAKERASSGATRQTIADRARNSMDNKAFDYSSSTMNKETMRRAGQRLTDSEYIKTAVAPGLREAFDQAGGRSGMAKRVIGGAAIGGATTGTIGAMQGEDFWESSKKGVVAGGAAGLGRQGYMMGTSQSGRELTESIRGQYDTAKGHASRAQAYGDMEDLGWNANEDGGAEWAERRAGEYKGQSFWENMKQQREENKNARARATDSSANDGASGKARNVNDDPLYGGGRPQGESIIPTTKQIPTSGSVIYSQHDTTTPEMSRGTLVNSDGTMATGANGSPIQTMGAPTVKASGAKNVSPTHTQGRTPVDSSVSTPVRTMMSVSKVQEDSESVAKRRRVN